MRILFASSEVAPFAKTGGLADVSGALPAALARLGHDVKVVMPKYAAVDGRRWGLTAGTEIPVHLAGRDHRFILWSGRLPDGPPGNPVSCYFLAHDHFFGRAGLYQEKGRDYPDNLERFCAFNRAALAVPRVLGWAPEILHANDWQAALMPLFSRMEAERTPGTAAPATLFTIHNLGYMGLSPAEQFQVLDLPPSYFTPETLEFYGRVNPLKAGLLFSTLLNTVSPTYSREIQTPELGCGLEGILQQRHRDLFGVINGVDYAQWSPARDPHLPARYDAEDLEGKRACKRALQKSCGLPAKAVPLFGMITRLTSQKGVDLVLDALEELMLLDLQLVILGSGEPQLEQALQGAAQRFPTKLSVRLAFDESFAHRIEAGADCYLMPSRYEPCGLNQLYSLRYGTIPIARRTGGLADTIIDATPSHLVAGTATGVLFESASSHELLTAVRLTISLYRQHAVWAQMMTAAMAADFSWERSAREYAALYERAIKAVA
ncbi:MAG TPA: glycogen synthase GlgA [Nitrospiria bacterium]|nr:glycogen synthase GlgA [Nitrospiria bacterium]